MTTSLASTIGTARTCSQCKVEQPIEQFSWKDRFVRKTTRCLSCRRANYKADPIKARTSASAYYKQNRESVLEKMRLRRRKDARVQMFKSARARATATGCPFGITLDDIQIPDKCPVLGIPLSVGESGCHAGSPSLDRIAPAKGYVPGNIVVVSFRANTIKSDASIEELKRVVSFYETITPVLP